MLCRIWSAVVILPLLGVVMGCDNRPNVIMPKEKAPPAPRPRVAGGGPAPSKPGPGAETREKLPAPKEMPADAASPDDKK